MPFLAKNTSICRELSSWPWLPDKPPGSWMLTPWYPGHPNLSYKSTRLRHVARAGEAASATARGKVSIPMPTKDLEFGWGSQGCFDKDMFFPMKNSENGTLMWFNEQKLTFFHRIWHAFDWWFQTSGDRVDPHPSMKHVEDIKNRLTPRIR